jgi:hypothetical protein
MLMTKDMRHADTKIPEQAYCSEVPVLVNAASGTTLW